MDWWLKDWDVWDIGERMLEQGHDRHYVGMVVSLLFLCIDLGLPALVNEGPAVVMVRAIEEMRGYERGP